jgi:hypothetical protein
MMAFKLTDDTLPAEAQEAVICTSDYNGILAGDVIRLTDPEYGTYLEWLAVPNTPDAAISTAEAIEDSRREKISGVKAVGLQKIQAIMPAITDFDDLTSLRDWWILLPAGLRSNFPLFQQVADIYVAGRDAVTFLNTASEAQLTAYNPVTDPSWPV